MKQVDIRTTLILFILTVTLLIGCDKEPPKPQAVVMNLGKIAEATGINGEMKIHTETMNQQFSEEMKALSAEISKEFEDVKAGLGDNPSEEDERMIKTLQGELKKRLIEAQKERNAIRMKEASEIRQSYLDDIMSIAKVITVEHGASIILKANGVFWSDGSVDITDEIVGRMPSGKDPQPIDSEQN